jgi:hypothetical protein
LSCPDMLPVNTSLGELSIDEIFIEYDGPQFFSCRDGEGRRLLAVHAPSTDDKDNWLYVYISPERLSLLRAGAVSLRDAFYMPEGDTLELVSFLPRGEVEVSKRHPSNLPDDWLPDEGERLDDWVLFPPESNTVQVLEGTLSRSALTEELPEFLRSPAPMWEISPEVLEYLHARRTPVAVAAARSGRLVLDLVIKKGTQRTDVPVFALGNLLTSAQGVVEAFTLTVPGDRTTAAVREAARLDAVAAFPSSFGIRLDTHQSALFPDPSLVQALNRLMDLLAVGNDPASLREILRDLGPRPALRFKGFARAMAKSDADFAIEVGIPGDMVARRAELSRSQVNKLVELLNIEVQQAEQFLKFRGKLVGVSLRTRFFRLEDDETSFSGRIDDRYLPSMHGKTIGGLYDAAILILTDLNDATGEESERHILTSLDPV